MISKRIIVLANSRKHYPMSCVAGRELTGQGAGSTVWGGWIRPVSDHDEGALSFVERKLGGPVDPKPLDVIDVPLAACVNDPTQPENWLIEKGQRWSKALSAKPGDLSSLIEEPANLWLQPGQKPDRADESFLRRMARIQSLYLIRPERFAFLIRSRTWEGETKKKLRAIFSYNGQSYDLALLDPLIGRKYFPDFPRIQDGFVETEDFRRGLLCVSLTPPFENGPHYKVVATVFEVPE
jgi:hypothetical protein